MIGPAPLRRAVATAGLGAVLGWVASGPARAERLVLSLSSQQVAINSNFSGAQLAVFGIIERDAQSVARPGRLDVVVTVRGPRESLTIRRKEPLGPVWLNRGQQKFVAVPALLGVYANRSLDALATPVFRRRMRVGIEAIIDAPDYTIDRGEDEDPYRSALIRLKRRERLYTENDKGVVFVTDNAFRTLVALPATAPLGEYEVEASLLSDGIAVVRESSRFVVLKAGFEERVTELARDRSLAYGLMTASIALLFGWFASVIFRRD